MSHIYITRSVRASKGIEWIQRNLMRYQHVEGVQATRHTLSRNQSVAVHPRGSFLELHEVSPYIELGKERGVSVTVVTITESPSEIVATIGPHAWPEKIQKSVLRLQHSTIPKVWGVEQVFSHSEAAGFYARPLPDPIDTLWRLHGELEWPNPDIESLRTMVSMSAGGAPYG